jgi:hypothetical protein
MGANLRNIALGVILLAVIVTAATSCKKTAEAPEQETEPWPIAAVWVGGRYSDVQDCSAPSLVVYSDGRVILKKSTRLIIMMGKALSA